MTKAPLHSRCEHCGASFVHRHRGRSTQRFCSHWCATQHTAKSPRPRPRYEHDGRLSVELQREVAAARAEAPSAPLFRPGNVG
jgi:hypothetical protein